MKKQITKITSLFIALSILVTVPIFATEIESSRQNLFESYSYENEVEPEDLEDFFKEIDDNTLMFDDEDIVYENSSTSTTNVYESETENVTTGTTQGITPFEEMETTSETAVEISKLDGEPEIERETNESNTTKGEEIHEQISEDPDITKELETEDKVFGETPVIITDSIEELAEHTRPADTPPFLTIEATSGDIEITKEEENIPSDISFEELTGEDHDEVVQDYFTESECTDAVVECLEDTGLYTIEDINETEISVVSDFSPCRVMVDAEAADSFEAYGAKCAIYYDDFYIFEYDSPEETKYAADMLKKDGYSVIVDYPIEAEAVGNYKIPDPIWNDGILGWGYDYMNLYITNEYPKNFSGEVIVAVIDTGININHKVFKGERVKSIFVCKFPLGISSLIT